MPPEKISKITDATAGHVHPGWVGQHTGLLADDGSTPIRLPGAPPRPAFTPLTSTNVRLKKAQYRTSVEHIAAVGDVIGFPALASTSMDQGRLAAYHLFDEPVRELHELQPIGIYTIPEISFCGRTEAELTAAAIPYETGLSRYRELARGAIVGDSYGMLKLLVSPEDRRLLGVHVFGTNATDLVHIGQAIMGCGGTVDYLVDTVLNYPTLSEAYKVAALDATNKIRALEAVQSS